MAEQEWLAVVRDRAQTFMATNRLPGMALAITQGGQRLLAEGFGHRDLAAGLPVTPDTVFGVASVTKSLTALGIMLLQDAGRLSTSDRITRWLPEFRGRQVEWHQAMTIHHFLTHTSGLPGMRALFHARAGSIAADPNRKRLGLVTDPSEIRLIRTYQELMELMAETEYSLLGPPGAMFNYSNEAYALLQGVIERASDQPFLEYMQQKVLEPLEMERSTFRTADLDRLEPVTQLYASEAVNGKPVVFHAPVWWDVGEIYTNGSLKSTVLDLMRYLEIYRTGGLYAGRRILSEAAVRQMITPHVTLPTGRQYGYGLDIQTDYHGVTLVGHGGAIKGVSAHVLLALEPGLCTAVLCNLSGLTPEQMLLGSINLRMGLPWETQRREYPKFPLAAERLAEYEGLYRSDEGTSARVYQTPDGLTIESGGLPLQARPYGPDQVVLTETGGAVRFVRGGDDQITGLFMGVRFLPRLG